MVFGTLVGIFLKDLVRRRMMWLLALITLLVVAVNYGVLKSMDEALGSGVSWDLASRRAASRLDEIVRFLRDWLGLLAILVAGLVAPESRRNGTTQFILSLGVDRFRAAAAQLIAMLILLVGGLGILHVGFAIVGMRIGALDGHDLAVAWVGLVIPLTATAIAAFSLSLTSSALETYLVFIGIPLLVRTIPGLARGFPHSFPRVLVHAIDNVALFFPDPVEMTSWPHASFGDLTSPPYPDVQRSAAQLVLVVLFWTTLGLWRLARHDFGSRTALK